MRLSPGVAPAGWFAAPARPTELRRVVARISPSPSTARAALLIGRSPSAAPAVARDRENLTMIHLEF